MRAGWARELTVGLLDGDGITDLSFSEIMTSSGGGGGDGAGPVSGSGLDLSADPTFGTLNLSAGGDFPLAFLAAGEGDVALAINLPDGSWVCDDDSAGDFDALVVLQAPQSGQYDIYVTHVGDMEVNPSAVLAITETIPAN